MFPSARTSKYLMIIGVVGCMGMFACDSVGTSLGGSIAGAVDLEGAEADDTKCAALQHTREKAEKRADLNAHSLVALMKDQRWKQPDQHKYLRFAQTQTEERITELRREAESTRYQLITLNCTMN